MNNFTCYLKFCADGPTIFQPGPLAWNFKYQVFKSLSIITLIWALFNE